MGVKEGVRFGVKMGVIDGVKVGVKMDKCICVVVIGLNSFFTNHLLLRTRFILCSLIMEYMICVG